MRLSVCVFLSVIVAGCGARVSKAPELLPQSPDARTAAEASQQATPPGPAPLSLTEFMAKARAIAAQARPPAKASIAHLEAREPKLAAALLAAKLAPSPETLRHAAEEYHRLGVHDRAHEYLHQAQSLDPRDAATYDALARLWRDGGFSDVALADAQRALYYAPASAAAHNTLGTVFQALGRRKQAAEQYQRALQLDPTAAYALNNLCYGWILDRQPDKAVEACEAALRVNPALTAARNNLGLAYAARGDLDATRDAFARAGDNATALYNLGIVYMGRREYRDAVNAFAAAQQARPWFTKATEREVQAGKLALAGDD